MLFASLTARFQRGTSPPLRIPLASGGAGNARPLRRSSSPPRRAERVSSR